jgi:hypothetical protein
MNGEILAAGFAAAQHSARAGAMMMMMLAALVAIVLAVIGIAQWQGRRARAERQGNSHDRSAQYTRSPEDK